jgi:hypothetical protein
VIGDTVNVLGFSVWIVDTVTDSSLKGQAGRSFYAAARDEHSLFLFKSKKQELSDTYVKRGVDISASLARSDKRSDCIDGIK